MNHDDTCHELERLAAMGRQAPENPTDRELLVARILAPWAWSSHAQEQIDWCRKNGLAGSPSHFGAHHLAARRLAVLRAQEIIRRLERHDAGLPDLEAFDAHAMSADLGKEQFQLHLNRAPRDYVSHQPAKEVFFLKMVDGIPRPSTRMDPTGAVTLTWREEDREAQVHIACDKTTTMTIGAQGGDPILLDMHAWRASRTPTLIAATTDWIYFGGPYPHRTGETALQQASAA